MATPPFRPDDPLDIDWLLTEEERSVRETVRDWCRERVRPHIGAWFESGDIPMVKDLAEELGGLGLLGMHLSGYGCAGAGAVAYGAACAEL